MPGAATHIAIADKIYSIWGNDIIKNLPLFFCGNIAPDAIHTKPNYKREDKRHTHLTQDMPTDAFHNPVKLKIFHDRVNEFIKNYYHKYTEEKDLYLGYIIHLLTDELFNITKRTPFNRLQFTEGIDPNEQEYFSRILADIDYGDKFILAKYLYEQNVSEVLNAVWDYEIKGYIGKEELNNSKHYTINKFNNRVFPLKTLKYYSYDEAVDFIYYAVDDIIARLSGSSNILKIL